MTLYRFMVFRELLTSVKRCKGLKFNPFLEALKVTWATRGREMTVKDGIDYLIEKGYGQ